MTEQDIRLRAEAARVGRLATVDVLGAPHLVPICYALAGDVAYSATDAKPKRAGRLARFANVAREPRVCLLVDHYEESWERLWWIRLDGRGAQLDAGPEFAAALQLLAGKYPQYREAPPPGPVLRLQILRWRGWSAA